MMKSCLSLLKSPHLTRRLIQTGAAVLCLSIAWQFFKFIQWAGSDAVEIVLRPAGVEGFLPISALLGLKQFLLTGRWDAVHPAGLTLLVAVLISAWLFRKNFCASICPVGFFSSLLETLGKRMRLARVLPPWLDYPMMAPKYLLMAFFIFTTFFLMDLRQIDRFIRSPYNLTADARLLDFFMHPSTTTLAVLGCLIILTLVWRNFWCRYLCPYGALLGLFSLVSPFRINRRPDACVHCGRCTTGCPSGIRVEIKQDVRSPECMGCGECIENCPVPGCLSVRAGSHQVPSWMLPVGVVALLVLAYGMARLTGHWNGALPVQMLKKMYTAA